MHTVLLSGWRAAAWKLQSVDVGRDGSNLGSQKSDRFLLLCNLGCEVVIDLGAIFASFGSGHCCVPLFLYCSFSIALWKTDGNIPGIL